MSVSSPQIVRFTTLLQATFAPIIVPDTSDTAGTNGVFRRIFCLIPSDLDFPNAGFRL